MGPKTAERGKMPDNGELLTDKIFRQTLGQSPRQKNEDRADICMHKKKPRKTHLQTVKGLRVARDDDGARAVHQRDGNLAVLTEVLVGRSHLLKHHLREKKAAKLVLLYTMYAFTLCTLKLRLHANMPSHARCTRVSCTPAKHPFPPAVC